MSRLKKIFTLKNFFKAITICVSLALVLAYLSPYIHPKNFGWIPLFGLAYPIIIICHLLVTITWIFINKKWAIAMGILILLGGNIHFRTLAIGNGDDPDGATEIKVMSYNVQLFDLYNPDSDLALKHRDEIIQYVTKEKPDILCFQEFYHQDGLSDFIEKDTLLKLLGIKDYHERYLHQRYGRKNFGINILSRYEIIKKGNVVFPDDIPAYNFCIYADILTPDDTIRVYNLHLKSIKLNKTDYAVFDNGENGEESSGLFSVVDKVKKAFPYRANQSNKIVEHIKNSPHPVVVCGDFNSTPMSYSYNQFNSILTDSFRNTSFGIGKTYAGKIPAGRIDYIFHSLELGSCNFDIQEEKLSDHYAINCSIFKKKE